MPIRGTNQDFTRLEPLFGQALRSARIPPTVDGGIPDPATVDRLCRRWAGLPADSLFGSLDRKKILERLKDPSRHSLPLLQLSLQVIPPGRFRARASEIHVRYGRIGSPFGEALLGVSEEGLCHFSFAPPGAEDSEILRRYLPGVCLRHDPEAVRAWEGPLFSLDCIEPIPAWLTGTPFQIDVWRALARLPIGCIESYGQLAGRVGRPGAARAVGTAMARNPLAWLVPCHRVVRQDGSLGFYQSGPARKAAMLAWEYAHCALRPAPGPP